MIQFECQRVTYPSVPFTFGSNVGCPFPPHAGKGKFRMWPVNKVEIHFAKTGFVDSISSNLNAPGSHNPWCHSLLGPSRGVPLPCMQEKGNAACGLLIKWKFILQK